MRQNMSGWSQAECDELKKAGIADEILYYHRALGKEEKYTAHVFIAQYASPEQLKQNFFLCKFKIFVFMKGREVLLLLRKTLRILPLHWS